MVISFAFLAVVYINKNVIFIHASNIIVQLRNFFLLQKAYKSAYLVRFGISLIPHAHPFLKEFLGCMVIEAGLSEPHTCETAFYARVHCKKLRNCRND